MFSAAQQIGTTMKIANLGNKNKQKKKCFVHSTVHFPRTSAVPPSSLFLYSVFLCILLSWWWRAGSVTVRNHFFFALFYYTHSFMSCAVVIIVIWMMLLLLMLFPVVNCAITKEPMPKQAIEQRTSATWNMVPHGMASKWKNNGYTNTCTPVRSGRFPFLGTTKEGRIQHTHTHGRTAARTHRHTHKLADMIHTKIRNTIERHTLFRLSR